MYSISIGYFSKPVSFTIYRFLHGYVRGRLKARYYLLETIVKIMIILTIPCLIDWGGYNHFFQNFAPHQLLITTPPYQRFLKICPPPTTIYLCISSKLLQIQLSSIAYLKAYFKLFHLHLLPVVCDFICGFCPSPSLKICPPPTTITTPPVLALFENLPSTYSYYAPHSYQAQDSTI